MSEFKIGDRVKLNTKYYTIVGTVKRSWLLEDANGKKYKATSNMMNRIKEQNKRGIGTGKRRNTNTNPTRRIEERLRYMRIFDKSAKMPETEDECMSWLSRIACDLSPENLTCDGELSRSAVRAKASALRAEWKEVEKILGRKVTEDEVWDYERLGSDWGSYRNELERGLA